MTVTVTRLRSAGGRSATQSPTCRSIHFTVREPGGGGAATAGAVAQVASNDTAARPQSTWRLRTRIAAVYAEVSAGSGFSDDIDRNPRTQRAASNQFAGFFMSSPPRSCLIMVRVSK